jgi:hypothetical protein
MFRTTAPFRYRDLARDRADRATVTVADKRKPRRFRRGIVIKTSKPNFSS